MPLLALAESAALDGDIISDHPPNHSFVVREFHERDTSAVVWKHVESEANPVPLHFAGARTSFYWNSSGSMRLTVNDCVEYNPLEALLLLSNALQVLALLIAVSPLRVYYRHLAHKNECETIRMPYFSLYYHSVLSSSYRSSCWYPSTSSGIALHCRSISCLSPGLSLAAFVGKKNKKFPYNKPSGFYGSILMCHIASILRHPCGILWWKGGRFSLWKQHVGITLWIWSLELLLLEWIHHNMKNNRPKIG